MMGFVLFKRIVILRVPPMTIQLISGEFIWFFTIFKMFHPKKKFFKCFSDETFNVYNIALKMVLKNWNIGISYL